MARPKDYDTQKAVEAFAQAIMDGHRPRDAYRISHPTWKSTNTRSSDVRACEFKRRPDVQERLAELRAEMRERHQEFTDRLVEMLQEEITTCYEDNKTLSPVIKQVEIAMRVLGMDKQVIDVNAKVAKTDPDTVADKINFLAGKAKGGK